MFDIPDNREELDALTDTEKANIRMEQEFYGLTEEEDLNDLDLLDVDNAALRNRNQS
jgi:hypothetical protein